MNFRKLSKAIDLHVVESANVVGEDDAERLLFDNAAYENEIIGALAPWACAREKTKTTLSWFYPVGASS